MSDTLMTSAAGRPPLPPPNPLLGFIACECGGSHDFRDHPDEAAALTHVQALQEVDRLNRAITRVLRLLADQEAYCGDERLDVPSWVHSVRKALNDE